MTGNRFELTPNLDPEPDYPIFYRKDSSETLKYQQDYNISEAITPNKKNLSRVPSKKHQIYSCITDKVTEIQPPPKEIDKSNVFKASYMKLLKNKPNAFHKKR